MTARMQLLNDIAEYEAHAAKLRKLAEQHPSLRPEATRAADLLVRLASDLRAVVGIGDRVLA